MRAALGAGATVFFSYLTSAEDAETLKKEGAQPVKLDLTDRNAVSRIKATIKQAHGRLDALVMNAAMTADASLRKLSTNDWDRVIEADLSSVFRLTRALLPLLYRSEHGKILNVVSRIGLLGSAGGSNYAAAKAGLIAFTKSLAGEVGRKGILVNAFNPGFMISKMTADLPLDVMRAQKESSLLGEYSNAEEAADFMVYLLSDRVRSATGQTYHYDSRLM